MSFFSGITDAIGSFGKAISPVSSLISGGLSLLGGINSNNANQARADQANQFSAEQVEKMNQFNSEQAAINRTFNESEATKNRDFQANQTATQYQRAKSDLIAAGFNPMLAYTQGGNTAASGGQASGQAATGGSAQGQYARYQNPYEAASNSYNSTARTAIDLEKLPKLIEQIVQDTLTSASTEYRNDESRKNINASTDKIIQEIINAKSDNERIIALAALLKAQKGLTNASADKVRQDYDIDKPDQDINSSAAGTSARAAERIINSIKGLRR